ncbi:disease resistance protein RGA3 [Canna indica]|uniref:Disease resistance protein RGA3 n=1 Tax=Canna indica TaxID=4628 RepID=A0AAQ3QKL0_9LILI|nr:disease resistance protein RGA3 [Canna indica]
MDRLEFLGKIASFLGIPELGRKLVEWACSKVWTEVGLIRGLEGEVEKLRRTTRRIQHLLADAEDRRNIEDELVKRWLYELKVVFFNADDLLDRYQTLLQVSKLAKNKGTSSLKRKRSLSISERHSMGGEIVNLQERLNEIDASKKKLHLKPSDGKRRDQGPKDFVSPPASAFCDKSSVVGRNEQLNSIVKALKAEYEKHLPVIPIYGVPGVGKTTLAQFVFNYFAENKKGRHSTNPKLLDKSMPGDDINRCFENNGEGTSLNPTFPRDGKEKRPVVDDHDKHQLENNGEGTSFIPEPVQDGKGKKAMDQGVFGEDKHFEMKIWASLPKGCDAIRATKEIIEWITKKKCNFSSLNILQHHLKGHVEGKKFLLVLDNFWAEDSSFWDSLRLPLLAGAKGSKVLITTRNEVVWRGMDTQDVIHLEGLEYDDCWKLLQDLAFPQSTGIVNEDLKEIGLEIVSRCQGSPLATKSLSTILYEKLDLEIWESIRDEMWALKEHGNEILPSLMISYHHLNFQMKQCFAYCSVFPNDYEFDKDELVQMWIAEGLVERNGMRRLEAIGSRYFDYLQWRLFFETSSKSNHKYRMPSLIHDLARVISKNELLIMKDNELHDPPEEPRYASLSHQKQDGVAFEKLHDYARLRTLKLCTEFSAHVGQVPEDLFEKLKCLRVLDFSNSDIEKLPDSIGDLIHLRYLGLTATRIKELPETVSCLYNLRTLELSKCSNLLSLPKGISNLVNLTHLGLRLDWNKFNDLNSMPPGIHHLTSLQTLSRFTVTTEVNCNIGELRDLNIRGELCISKLENIVDADDAGTANLMGKKYIDKMMLRWTDGTSSNALAVISKLRPHKNLKCLWILNYPGRTFPMWLEEPSFSNLETLRLSCSGECERFPSITLLPRLKDLHVERMKGVKSLGNMRGFPSLETLTVEDMTDLDMLFESDASNMPKLRQIMIYRCPKLPNQLDLPPGIKLRRDDETSTDSEI